MAVGPVARGGGGATVAREVAWVAMEEEMEDLAAWAAREVERVAQAQTAASAPTAMVDVGRATRVAAADKVVAAVDREATVASVGLEVAREEQRWGRLVCWRSGL